MTSDETTIVIAEFVIPVVGLVLLAVMAYKHGYFKKGKHRG